MRAMAREHEQERESGEEGADELASLGPANAPEVDSVASGSDSVAESSSENADLAVLAASHWPAGAGAKPDVPDEDSTLDLSTAAGAEPGLAGAHVASRTPASAGAPWLARAPRWLWIGLAGFALGLGVGAAFFAGLVSSPATPSRKPAASAGAEAPAKGVGAGAHQPRPSDLAPAIEPLSERGALDGEEREQARLGRVSPAVAAGDQTAARATRQLHKGSSAATAVRRRRARRAVSQPAGIEARKAVGPRQRLGARAAGSAAREDEVVGWPDSEGEATGSGAKAIDRVLEGELGTAVDGQAAVGSSGRGKASFGSSLPDTPSREDVARAVRVMLPAIRGCARGRTGLATAEILVKSDGRVARIQIRGADFANTPEALCMEGVMRKARFPRFTQPAFRVQYPLRIRAAPGSAVGETTGSR